jgi:hypothetical protein
LAIAIEDVEQGPDRKITEHGVAEMGVQVDRVAVATPDFGALDVFVGDQVGEDPLRGSFGDADLLGDVACPDLRVARDAEQHVRVVGEESPGA